MEWPQFFDTLIPLLSSLITLLITTGSQMYKDHIAAKRAMHEQQSEQKLEEIRILEKRKSENMELHRKESQDLQKKRMDLYYEIIESVTISNLGLVSRCESIYSSTIKLLSLCDPSRPLYSHVNDLISYFHSSAYTWGMPNDDNMAEIRKKLHAIGSCMYNQDGKG